jgi:hypothetical protein
MTEFLSYKLQHDTLKVPVVRKLDFLADEKLKRVYKAFYVALKPNQKGFQVPTQSMVSIRFMHLLSMERELKLELCINKSIYYKH